MSYLGWAQKSCVYMSYISEHFSGKKIYVLEIGVDRGQTALPLIHNLICRGLDFRWLGVDIRYDKGFNEQLHFMEGVKPATPGENVSYIKANSLDFLPIFVKENPNFMGFDLVMLDGDHNYETLFQELSYLDDITHTCTLCLIDDYNGKHAIKDSFYADNIHHKEIEHTELNREAEKQGVKNAVDDFVEMNSKWTLYNPFPDEDPVVLFREGADLIHDKEKNMILFNIK